jgi:hypothetical protein
MPLAVVWFGALGAVLISLTGIVDHSHNWDNSYDLWHLSRPLIGASLAIVSVLILQAGVLAIGSAPTPGTADRSGALPQNLLYYLVAFLVGYREETFRELIKRLGDLILTPATPPPAPRVTAVDPPSAPAAARVPVRIAGTGFTKATSVMFGTQRATFKVDSDTQITAQLPSAASPGAVTVLVKTPTGSDTAQFTYT